MICDADIEDVVKEELRPDDSEIDVTSRSRHLASRSLQWMVRTPDSGIDIHHDDQ